MNFRRSIIIAELWRPWSRKTLETMIFLHFLEKRPLTGKFLKLCSKSFHRDTDRRIMFKFREIWPTEKPWSRVLFTWQKKTKFHLALQLSLLRGSPPKSARASHRQCAHCSECSRFDPNWFTYGGDISERVNTVIARSKESNIRLKPSFEPNNYQQQF